MTKEEAILWLDDCISLNLKKEHLDIKSEIIQQTSFLSDDVPMQQRLWHIINDTVEPVKCTTKLCVNHVKWTPAIKRYNMYCSAVCASTDPDKVARSQAWKKDPQKVQNANAKGLLNRQATNVAKYGHTNYLASVEGKQTISRRDSVIEKLEEDYEMPLDMQQKIIELCMRKYGDLTVPVEDLKFHPVQIPANIGKDEISKFLTENGVSHETSSVGVVPGLTFDLYISEYKIAIDFCGLYWHSEQQGMGRHYHEYRHNVCRDQGIQLLTIFEDEWSERKPQVKRKLIHLMGGSGRKVFARKTYVVKMNNKQKTEFFEEHHIQGSGPGSIVYGLVYNNKIVASMAFIKQPGNVYALNRYATACTVVGGFTKLLKHFQNDNEWVQIISFADQRWSNGNLYEKTGFILDSVINPDYYYSPDGINRIHKFNYRRKNLHKLLKHFDESLSECVNCNNNGVLRLWDCGKRRYVLNNENIR